MAYLCSTMSEPSAGKTPMAGGRNHLEGCLIHMSNAGAGATESLGSPGAGNHWLEDLPARWLGSVRECPERYCQTMF